jgi:hypothetical protein
MPSPFPGMDPFLEEPKIWAHFQHHLIASLYQLLLPSFVDRYKARIVARQYKTEFPLFTSIIRQEHTEEYIEVRGRTDDRLITLVETVSISNRTSTEGRAAYLKTRKEALACRASVVEIDLISQGKPMLDYARDGLPELDYSVTVTRGHTPDRYEIYTTTLPKRLPKFKLPLASEDRDTILDLQIAMARAYDLGNLVGQVNYKGAIPADVKFNDTSRAWIDEFLSQNKLK